MLSFIVRFDCRLIPYLVFSKHCSLPNVHDNALEHWCEALSGDCIILLNSSSLSTSTEPTLRFRSGSSVCMAFAVAASFYLKPSLIYSKSDVFALLWPVAIGLNSLPTLLFLNKIDMGVWATSADAFRVFWTSLLTLSILLRLSFGLVVIFYLLTSIVSSPNFMDVLLCPIARFANLLGDPLAVLIRT